MVGARGAPGRGPGGRVGGGPGPLTTRKSAKTAASTCSTTPNKRPGSRRPAKWVVGITRPGTGPNGETVVGDNERALQLFYSRTTFRSRFPSRRLRSSALSGAMARPGSPPISPTSRFSNRVQGHYTQEFPDDTITLPGTGGAGDTKGSFRIHRAKLKLEGWFWAPPASGSLASPGAPPSPRTMPKLSYEVQLNWAAVSATSARSRATSAPSSRTPTSPGTRRAWASFASSSDSKSAVRPAGDDLLRQPAIRRPLAGLKRVRARARHRRVRSGRGLEQQAEYRVGMFNGNGLTRPSNDNDKFQYNARLMWQPNGNQVLAQRAWVSGALYPKRTSNRRRFRSTRLDSTTSATIFTARPPATT